VLPSDDDDHESLRGMAAGWLVAGAEGAPATVAVVSATGASAAVDGGAPPSMATWLTLVR